MSRIRSSIDVCLLKTVLTVWLLLFTVGPLVSAVEEPDPCLQVVPANASGVFLCDFRADNPSMKVLRSGQRTYTWDVLEAWGMTVGHGLLMQVDKQLRLKEDLLDCLDGRYALVLLPPRKGSAEPQSLFIALIKSEETTQKSLDRIVEGTRQWKTKVYTTEYGGRQVTHVINKEQQIDLCFTVDQHVLAMADSTATLQSWFDARKENASAATSTCGAALERFPEGIIRFYVKLSDVKGLRDKVPAFPSIHAMNLVGAGNDLLALKPRAGVPGTKGASEEPGGGASESPANLLDCIVGSLTYRDTGVVARIAATLNPASQKDRESWKELSQVRELYPDAFTFSPGSPLVLIAAPNLRAWVQAAGKDVDDADIWSGLLGVDQATAKEKVPASLKQVLSGDVVICLPELRAAQSADGKPGKIEDINPLDYAPFILAVRAPDECDWEKTLPELKAFFRETFKVQLQDADSVTAIYPPEDQTEGKRDKPVGYFTVVGHHLLISPDKGQLVQSVQRLKDGKNLLDNNENFKEVAAAAFAGSATKVYFDPVEFAANGGEVAMTAADMPNPYIRHAIKLTLDGLRGMGVGLKVNESMIEGACFMGLDYDKLTRLSNLYAYTVPVMAAIAFPEFTRAREKARMVGCQSNLKQIGLAALMYCSDHGETLPNVSRWRDQLFPYFKHEQVFHCPSDTGSHPNSYGMNARLYLKNLTSVYRPGETVLFFDATGTSNSPFGTANIVAKRHNGGANVCFVDGHVKWMQSIPANAWEPKKR